MFWIRLRSGILLLAAAVALLVAGGPVMTIGILAVSLQGMWELYRVLGLDRQRMSIVGYCTAAAWFAALFLNRQDLLLPVLVLSLLVMMAFYVIAYPKYNAAQLMGVFFGFVYVALMLSYMVQIRALPNGAFLVWLVFISSWGCDTCAYCVGMLFGKHKMAPVLSPKKSVEGAVGGVIGAALIGMIYALVFRNHLTVFRNPLFAMAMTGALGGLISMVGDLTASAIKRNYGIKDYGTLIPGHGGILDRFDSVIITAPLVYYLVLLLMTGI